MTGSAPDIRLIAVDLDGTLLDEAGEVPPGTWGLLDRLRQRDIMFAPASGRQYAKLLDVFAGHTESMVMISENGNFVVRDGVELASSVMGPDVVRRIVEHARTLRRRLGVRVVLCGKRAAYVEPSEDAFVAVEVTPYFSDIEEVPDLLAVTDDILKLSVFSPGDAETLLAPEFAPFSDSFKVVVTTTNWVDIMQPDANKGTALRAVQGVLGVTREQTMAFGDYPNDLEMLDAAAWSYAMGNAHPEVKARAKHLAPSNAEHGVLKVITDVLEV